jgi:hypothetical protein
MFVSRKLRKSALEAVLKTLPETVEDYMPHYGKVSEVVVCVRDILASPLKELIHQPMKL